MSRKFAREQAFKLIYEYCITNKKNPLTYKELTAEGDMAAEDAEYVNGVFNGATAHFDELSAEIARTAEGFSLERVYKIDLAILLLALYEIRYLPEVPVSVAINEAVELAKTYSTEKSKSFINGILAQAVK